MGWETRGSRRYYYRKKRSDDGTVQSVYVGSGTLANAVDLVEREGRAALALARHVTRTALAPVDNALRLLLESERETARLCAAHLLATGHRTHRGQWRRKRTSNPTNPADMPAESLTVQQPITEKEAEALFNECNKDNPDPAKVYALRAWLAENPLYTLNTDTNTPPAMSFARRSALASIMRRAHKAARRMLAHFATYRAALSYALRCVYRAAQAKAYLHANAARVLVARFVKADGSVRRMRFVYTLGRPKPTAP